MKYRCSEMTVWDSTTDIPYNWNISQVLSSIFPSSRLHKQDFGMERYFRNITAHISTSRIIFTSASNVPRCTPFGLLSLASHDAIWRCVKNVGKVTWPRRLSCDLLAWSCDQSRDLLAWSRDLPGLVTWPQYNWSRDQALAIEYLACAFFIIKLKVEGNLKCGYNAQYHFQCKVAINLGSFESFILLCSWSQWRRSRGWTCNDHLRPRLDPYRYTILKTCWSKHLEL